MRLPALLAVLLLPQPAAVPGDLEPGLWSAHLDGPGGAVRFGLDLQLEDDAWQGWLVNGEERIEVPRVRWDGKTLRLHIEHYDASIAAAPFQEGAETVLVGTWLKRRSANDWTRMKFRAERDEDPSDARRSPPLTAPKVPSVGGRWRVDFESDAQPAVGLFEGAADGGLRGTFLTTTGDYRYLAGHQVGDEFELSCFDGAHAFLFKARLLDDGTLFGDFWSRDTWHETWTAQRDDTARLPDGFTLTRWTGEGSLGDLVFPDLLGKPRSLDDEIFHGKARIVQVFGSWCPNCHDATEFMVRLHERYVDRGLAIGGLAFELTGNFERDAEQVQRYADRHGVNYPLLVAGLADKEAASETLPILDRVRSYPTTIFLHGDGRVRAVYQGFSGPATGDAHTELTDAFEAIIEELLEEG